MRRYDEILGAGTRIFPDGKIKHGEDVYVYSTSWRMTLPPFCFYPWTTIAPVSRDFSKAISFRWNRAERGMLAFFIHSEVIKTVRQSGLEVLYRLALLCYVRGSRQPALLEMARWHKGHERPFPLSELVWSIKSFAPVKAPKSEEIQWARSVWAEIEADKRTGPATPQG
jgi:hypothetical protein